MPFVVPDIRPSPAEPFSIGFRLLCWKEDCPSGPMLSHNVPPFATLLPSILLFGVVGASAASPPLQETPSTEENQSTDSEVDLFMKKVLVKRENNWEDLRNYVFREVETLEVKGSEIAALAGFRREYLWIVRDGYLLRSPVQVNGVKVSEKRRRSEEEKWKRGKQLPDELSRSAFLEFPFEKGRYFFAGPTTFEDRPVVQIEYYPRKLFSKEGKDEDERTRKILDNLEKTTLVSLLVDPREHQIVRFTFENVGLDFLPYRWLIRVDNLKLSMTLDQPIIGDVWLPRSIGGSGRVTTAAGWVEIAYSRRFSDYRKTDVKVKLRFEDRNEDKRE